MLPILPIAKPLPESFWTSEVVLFAVAANKAFPRKLEADVTTAEVIRDFLQNWRRFRRLDIFVIPTNSAIYSSTFP